MNSAAKACTVLVIGLAGCQQNESDWIVFGTSDSPQFNETYSYQARSVEVFETKSKELAGVMIVSILDNRSKQILELPLIDRT